MSFSERPPIYTHYSCITISGGRTKQHAASLALRVISLGRTEQLVIISGLGELAAVD